jgi:hypothetical protein
MGSSPRRILNEQVQKKPTGWLAKLAAAVKLQDDAQGLGWQRARDRARVQLSELWEDFGRLAP